MRALRCAIVAGAAALVTGCVMMPTGPMIGALPGSQKSGPEFQSDDNACRGEANAFVSGVYPSGTSYSLQRYYDVKYLECMYAHGNRVPAEFAPDAYVQTPNSAPAYPPRDYPPPTNMPRSAPAASGAPK